MKEIIQNYRNKQNIKNDIGFPVIPLQVWYQCNYRECTFIVSGCIIHERGDITGPHMTDLLNLFRNKALFLQELVVFYKSGTKTTAPLPRPPKAPQINKLGFMCRNVGTHT